MLVDGKNRDVLQFYSKTNGPLLLLSNFCRLPISFAHSDLPKPVVSLFSTSFPLKNKLSFITGEHAFHSFKFLSIAAASKGKDEESDEGGRKRALILRALKFEGDKPFFKTAAEVYSIIIIITIDLHRQKVEEEKGRKMDFPLHLENSKPGMKMMHFFIKG